MAEGAAGPCRLSNTITAYHPLLYPSVAPPASPCAPILLLCRNPDHRGCRGKAATGERTYWRDSWSMTSMAAQLWSNLYIQCECDDRGCHMVGHFFKEKQSDEHYNLACILTLPPYQRKAYELSKKKCKVGTPERPLSDLGMLSYRGYWTRVLFDILKKHKSNTSIKELSDMTA